MNTARPKTQAETLAPPPPGRGELIERHIAARGFAGVLLLGPRAWRRWWHAVVRSIDHPAILAEVEEDASFSFNFNFMIVVAGGIATIGLLLNSPAVIIGAMLISPLMGPIMGLGFALAIGDWEWLKQSIRTLLIGTCVQDARTDDMIFDVPALIEFLSGSTTLLPGTVILTGTPEGVGMAADPPRWLKPGDSVSIEIEAIGQLTNPVIAEPHPRVPR